MKMKSSMKKFAVAVDGVVVVVVVVVEGGSVHFFLPAVNPPPALNLKWMMSPSSTI
jgi:hypothetical protein